MKIKEARLCVNCDEIHKGYTCPKCGVGPSYWIALWIDCAISIGLVIAVSQ